MDNKALKDKEHEIPAFDRAVSYLSYAPRTAMEVWRHLAGKNYEKPDIYDAVERLRELKYLDDREYCRMYIESHRGKKAMTLLKYELLDKGVKSGDIGAVLEEIDTNQNEELFSLVQSAVHGHVMDKKFYEKMIRRFSARGFSIWQIKSALARAGREGV